MRNLLLIAAGIAIGEQSNAANYVLHVNEDSDHTFHVFGDDAMIVVDGKYRVVIEKSVFNSNDPKVIVHEDSIIKYDCEIPKYEIIEKRQYGALNGNLIEVTKGEGIEYVFPNTVRASFRDFACKGVSFRSKEFAVVPPNIAPLDFAAESRRAYINKPK